MLRADVKHFLQKNCRPDSNQVESFDSESLSFRRSIVLSTLSWRYDHVIHAAHGSRFGTTTKSVCITHPLVSPCLVYFFDDWELHAITYSHGLASPSGSGHLSVRAEL